MPSILRLIELVGQMRDRSLKPNSALFLMWNQDISGKSTPADSTITGLARTLRGVFAAVESQFALTDDPNGEIAKALLTLVYGAEATDFLFGIINNTIIVSVPFATPQSTLAQSILNAA